MDLKLFLKIPKNPIIKKLFFYEILTQKKSSLISGLH